MSIPQMLLTLIILSALVLVGVVAQNLNSFKIMSAIREFAEKQAAFNATIEQSVDSIVTSIGGITADVKNLNDLITQLQNSSGTVSTEDQALIDQVEAAGQALADKTEAAAKTAADLDAATPPVPPTA